MKVLLTEHEALTAAWDAKAHLAPSGSARVLPDGVRSWLAALRLLDGVPFQHLVVDDRLLPPESIRFFYLDRNWTDALVAGALSVGTITTQDRAQMQAIYPAIRDELDRAERKVRVPGNETGLEGPADVMTGLLLRSAVVSGWPAMHVRAYTEDVPGDEQHRLHLMRLERLAPTVLLALFDGVPGVVHIEEPRCGVQFGFEIPESKPAHHTAYVLPLRVAGSAKPTSEVVHVPFRKGAPGVIDVQELQKRIEKRGGATPSEFALEILRFPYRQVFGPQAPGAPAFTGSFHVETDINMIRQWPGYASVAKP